MFVCFYCGENLEDIQRSEEHIIPESIGGNITSWKICKDCNTRANQEIDEKFKNQWFVSWDRALLGIPDKHEKKHTDRIETIKEDGEKIQLLVCEEGLVPITKPDVNIDWESGKGSIKVDPRYVENVLSDVKKKAIKKGKQFDDLITLPDSISQEVGKVQFSFSMDLKVIRREQVKILLGLGCFYIPNFTNSYTAASLRKYLWEGNGKERVENIQSQLYPFNVNENALPSFSVDENIIYTHPNDGMEIETIMQSLNIEKEHIFCFYQYRGKLRLFLSIFGNINAVIDTNESHHYFFPGPIPFQPTAYIIYPKEKKNEKINIENIMNIIPSLASAKLAGFFSSKPGLLNSIRKGGK